MFNTLIDPATLAAHVDDANWIVVDCRFDLADPPKGEQLYLESHIPGARYAHLDRDLCPRPAPWGCARLRGGRRGAGWPGGGSRAWCAKGTRRAAAPKPRHPL